MPKFAKSIKNDLSRKGQFVTKKKLFGKNHRYAIAPVHSRFDSVGWLVWDAETPGDEYDPVLGWSPAVIRTAKTYEDAVAGLM